MSDWFLGKTDAKRLPLADRSVHSCATSPPYFGLRDYGVDGQLGLEPTPDAYVSAMVRVFREVRRVLRDDGTLWLNIGDSYNAYNGNRGPSTSFSAGTEEACPKLPGGYGLTDKSLKPKDLIGIPWRLALALQADGWYLRSDIIWAKLNPMPESVTDRPTKAHEYVFLLAKRERYFYDADAVREAGSDNPVTVARKGRADNGCVGTAAIWGDGYGQSGTGLNAAVRAMDGRNLRTVWPIATQPYSGAHFATMPPELARRCIRAGTSERGCCPSCGSPWIRVVEREPMVIARSDRGSQMGEFGRSQASETMVSPARSRTVGWRPSCTYPPADPVPCVVLDPFNGSGTTGHVATTEGRRYIGFDLNPDYLTMSADRIARGLRPSAHLAARPIRPASGQLSLFG